IWMQQLTEVIITVIIIVASSVTKEDRNEVVSAVAYKTNPI
ncbi:16496_t:CDS:1, partial [Funneliformis geosporum]